MFSWQVAEGKVELCVPDKAAASPGEGTKAWGDICRRVTSLGKPFGWFAACSQCQCLDWKSKPIPYLWAGSEDQGILGILLLVLAQQEVKITCGLGVVNSRMCLVEDESCGTRKHSASDNLLCLGHKYQPSGDFCVPAGKVWWLKPKIVHVQAIDYIWA